VTLRRLDVKRRSLKQSCGDWVRLRLPCDASSACCAFELFERGFQRRFHASDQQREFRTGACRLRVVARAIPGWPRPSGEGPGSTKCAVFVAMGAGHVLDSRALFRGIPVYASAFATDCRCRHFFGFSSLKRITEFDAEQARNVITESRSAANAKTGYRPARRR
jgi:hypothetical protein